MSLYNLIFGFSAACFCLLPMLGRKEEEYPRFRDCFLGDNKDTIVIYTRVGGDNRESGYGEEKLYKDPNFLKTWDDDLDSTYGYYEFKIPEKWRSDFDKIVAGEGKSVSEEYKAILMGFSTKLTPTVFGLS